MDTPLALANATNRPKLRSAHKMGGHRCNGPAPTTEV
jgi:hypothetical protein